MTSNGPGERVWWVEGDARTIAPMGTDLTRSGHQVEVMASCDELIVRLNRTPRAERPTIILVDFDLIAPPEHASLAAIVQQSDRIPVVVTMDTLSNTIAGRLGRAGAYDILSRPVTAAMIEHLLHGGDRSKGARFPTLAELEEEHLRRALFRCDGNISACARLLRIERKTLQRKLDKLPGFDRKSPRVERHGIPLESSRTTPKPA